jgi:hypothetical protein
VRVPAQAGVLPAHEHGLDGLLLERRRLVDGARAGRRRLDVQLLLDARRRRLAARPAAGGVLVVVVAAAAAAGARRVRLRGEAGRKSKVAAVAASGVAAAARSL